jgi:hypothetical protein
MISRSFHFRRLGQSPCRRIVQKLSLECRSDAAGTEVSAASQAKGWRVFFSFLRPFSLALLVGLAFLRSYSLGPLFLVLVVLFFFLILVFFLVVFFVRILGIDSFKHG